MKNVLITGGATGIGKATAELFCQKGYNVFITRHSTLPEIGGVTAIDCDLESESDILNLFGKTGDIDILVNNAGISLIKQINDTTAQEYDRIMSVNARSYFLCSREAAKMMIKKHSGSIINISSMWGQTGASCEIAYSMSKAAVIGLTRSLAQELAPSGIAVNCVCPGIIDTRMNAAFSPDELKEEVPMGRLGTPQEVASAVLALAQSTYVTGQIIGVNGGIV